MIRPFCEGPRSVMRTKTVRPFAMLLIPGRPAPTPRLSGNPDEPHDRLTIPKMVALRTGGRRTEDQAGFDDSSVVSR
jgi:hypothetical protein